MVGRRDYFATFEYRELSFAKNRILTMVSKFVMKYIWDCKTRNLLPELEHCWETVTDKIEYLTKYNKGFRTMWTSTNYILQLVRP
jgi:superoxide dismutase